MYRQEDAKASSELSGRRRVSARDGLVWWWWFDGGVRQVSAGK